ncbi:OmpA family protein [Flavobacterium sp.]|jgi:outer membrane protein OmpA-like peptidoglycan-associated protein|uniref:OmpA family protein n=1 Tax=Flavobacterium sp. TaxID=239 RepID=UPI0037C0B83D
MKQVNKFFTAALLFVGLVSQAQDSNNPWALSVGTNAVDTRVSATRSGLSLLDKHFSQTFDAKENWNFLPSVSYLSLTKYVGDGFSFGVTGSANKISKMVNFDPTSSNADPRGMVVSNPGDITFFGVDGIIRYSFQDMIKSKWLEPSAHIGGGYTFFGDASAGTVNGGVGVTIWFTEGVGLFFQSSYKHSYDDTRTVNVDVPGYMQHAAGLTFKFGGKDTDGDGIYDKEDSCPEVAGLAAFKGCPDTDSDGIQDAADSCPEVAGLAEFNGCPDTDGDGIVDAEDACVDVKGTKMMKGCPDADGDGVADKDDKCPSVKGAKENAGCPWPDTDGDSVLDKDDKCPTVAGTVANNGCPEVTADTMKKLNEYGKTILFNSGKASFQKQAFPILQAMTAILKEYPTANFSLEGHTDNTGSDVLNQKLSEERAAAVKTFLVENGINASRLTSKGFGESTPVESNKTAKGKANNRRVEVKLVK